MGVDPTTVDNRFIQFIGGKTASDASTSAWDIIWGTKSVGTAFCYAFLWLFGWLYSKVRRREGLGFGDVKLLAMTGAMALACFIKVCGVVFLGAARTDGVENEDVLKGTPEQAAEGLRLYREWRDRRAARTARGSVPGFRTATAEALGRAAVAGVRVETVTLPVAPGRPGGRKFGRLVHDILQHAGAGDEVDALGAIWGRRHGAGDLERTAAVEVARAALGA